MTLEYLLSTDALHSIRIVVVESETGRRILLHARSGSTQVLRKIREQIVVAKNPTGIVVIKAT
jgi:hypothetical protein